MSTGVQLECGNHLRDKLNIDDATTQARQRFASEALDKRRLVVQPTEGYYQTLKRVVPELKDEEASRVAHETKRAMHNRNKLIAREELPIVDRIALEQSIARSYRPYDFPVAAGKQRDDRNCASPAVAKIDGNNDAGTLSTQQQPSLAADTAKGAAERFDGAKTVPKGDGEIPQTPAVVDITATNEVPATRQQNTSDADKTLSAHPGIVDEIRADGERLFDATKSAIEAHPWLSGTIATVGAAAVAFAFRGRLETMFKTEANLMQAVQQTERASVLSKVGEIPDVARPQIEKLASGGISAEFQKTEFAYLGSLKQLAGLPSHYDVLPNESLGNFAERILNSRTAITGERINPEAISKEAVRLRELNSSIIGEKIEAEKLLVHDRAAIEKLAEITQFKHVPQLGQFLKQHGVSEDNIQQALRIQSAQTQDRKQLIGQILVDNNFATKEQIEQAFGQQNALKETLKRVRADIFQKTE